MRQPLFALGLGVYPCPLTQTCFLQGEFCGSVAKQDPPIPHALYMKLLAR